MYAAHFFCVHTNTRTSLSLSLSLSVFISHKLTHVHTNTQFKIPYSSAFMLIQAYSQGCNCPRQLQGSNRLLNEMKLPDFYLVRAHYDLELLSHQMTTTQIFFDQDAFLEEYNALIIMSIFPHLCYIMGTAIPSIAYYLHFAQTSSFHSLGTFS